MNTEKVILTPEYIAANIGAIIEWFCYGYSGNAPYSGKCKLLGTLLDRDRTRPAIEQISGDSLQYSWLEDGVYHYTDTGRVVCIGKEFDNLTLLWENPKYHNSFADNTPINYSVTHYIGTDLAALIQRTTSCNEVRILETGAVYMRINGAYILQP